MCRDEVGPKLRVDVLVRVRDGVQPSLLPFILTGQVVFARQIAADRVALWQLLAVHLEVGQLSERSL